VGITSLVETGEYNSIYSTWLDGEPHLVNDWAPDWDFGSQESFGATIEDGFTCLFEDWQTIPPSGVGDGYPDCYDGSDEEMQPQVWSCRVDVRLDSIEFDFGSGVGANHPLNSWQAFDEKIEDHPGFPEWCGTEVGVLQIGETQPNLPPADDIYGSWYGDDNYDAYDVGINARNATHSHYLWGGGTESQQDCEISEGPNGDIGEWSAEYNSCAFQASPVNAIDGELIWGEYGWTRYHWSGDYLYLAIPATVDTPPDIVWNGMGPRVTDFICDQDDRWERVQEWQVGDGIEDCDNGNDENPDADPGGATDPGGSADLDRMAEALEGSNLEKTIDAFSDRLEDLLQDNIPEEPKYDLEDLCATMLWDVSDVRVLGVALVLEEGLLFGPQIKNSIPHPTTTINVEFLSGQAARDAKSGVTSKVSMDDMAPASKHDLAELYEILGPRYLPGLDTTDSDGDGTMDFFDTDDDNDGIPDWNDPEPTTVEAESSSLPAPGLVASLSVIAAAAMLIPRRDD
jgi:hypothetical protein